MKRLTGLLFCVAAAGLFGCGDDGVECGDGTEEMGGKCVPTGSPVMCTDGTILDEPTNSCVIDPDSCQDGTVLVGGACVDPTGGLTVDVTEAAEPNGFDVNGERSEDPAGAFTLKPIGQKVVLQGNLNPQADRNEDGAKEGDIDTYYFEADEPTLLEISVDGVGGAAGGFVMFGAIDGFQNWTRFGLNLTGDTSKRQVFLPSGGIYLLAIADTRTLSLGEAPGDPDNKYYVSIEKKAIPTPTALTFTAGDVVQYSQITNGEVDFYSAPFGAGINNVDVTSYDPDFAASLVVNLGAGTHTISNESKSNGGDVFASARFGLGAGQTALIAIDHRINTSHATVDYRIHAHTREGKALKTDGTTETQNNINPTAGSNIDGHTFWYFDVNQTDALTGINLTWDTPVIGNLVDNRGNTISTFTSFTGTTRWNGYRGLVRTLAPGRYFFEVFAPEIAADAPIVATSTIMAVPAAALTLGTPLTDVAINAFNGNPFDYTKGGSEWHLISLGADADTAGATLRFYDPETTVGRLGTLATVSSTGTPGTSNPSSFFSIPVPADDSVDQGLVTQTFPDTLLAVVTTNAGTGTFDLTQAARDFTDEGNHAGPHTVTHTAVAIEEEDRYMIETPPGHTITITVTPSASVDPIIVALTDDEFPFDGVDDGGAGEAETYEYVMDSYGYLPFAIWNVGDAGTYDITITVTAPAPAFYTAAAGTTTWSNICSMTGANDVTPANRDDAMTSAITLPTPFPFYSANQTELKISTNGWLTFDATATSSEPYAVPFPSEFGFFGDPDANAKVSPYWDDFVNVRICTLSSGTKFIVQWRGTLYGAPTEVAQQAILDTADGSIEFVYAPYFEADGAFASAGVESATASQGTTVFYDPIDGVELAGTSIKLTHQ